MANFISYNQVIGLMKDIAQRSFIVNTFFLGRDWDLENSEDIIFPLLQVYPEVATMPQNDFKAYKTVEITLNCKVVDRVWNNSDSNVQDVHSDMLQLAQDIVNELNTNPYYSHSNASLVGDIQFTNIEEFEDDYSAGWQWSMTLRLINNNSYCGLPFDPLTDYSLAGPGSSGYTFNTQYLACDTVTGCTILQNYITNEINNSLSGGTGGGGFSGWTGSSGISSIIANNGTNQANGDYAIAGGKSNIADGTFSVAMGGYSNKIQGNGGYSFIGGGSYNSLSGESSFIGSGKANVIANNQLYAAVVSGQLNYVNGRSGLICNGYRNSATTFTTVVNGKFNLASGNYSIIGSGQNNRASGYNSVVGGGTQNTASGQISFVGGGQQNNASGYWSVVAGGLQNSATTYGSFVGGGRNNISSNNYTVIGGGQSNSATTGNATVAGGKSNLAGNYGAFVGGGKRNTVREYYSVIVGGYQNTVSGGYSSIVGGKDNIVTGMYSSVVGGKNITASQSETVYVPFLNVQSASTDNALTDVFVRDISGEVKLRSVSSIAPIFSGATNFYAKFTSGGSISSGMISDNGISSSLSLASSGDNINVSIISPNGFYYPSLTFVNNGATTVGQITGYAGRLYTSPLSVDGTIDMGANKIVNMSPGTNAYDAVNLGQLKDVTILSSTTACTISIDAFNSNYSITALTSACTFSVVSGNEQNFDRLIVRIKDGGVAQSLTFDPANFEAKGQALPTTTVANKLLTAGFIYDDLTGKFGCVTVSQEI